MRVRIPEKYIFAYSYFMLPFVFYNTFRNLFSLSKTHAYNIKCTYTFFLRNEVIRPVMPSNGYSQTVCLGPDSLLGDVTNATEIPGITTILLSRICVGTDSRIIFFN